MSRRKIKRKGHKPRPHGNHAARIDQARKTKVRETLRQMNKARQAEADEERGDDEPQEIS